MRLKIKTFLLLLLISVFAHTGMAFTPLGPFKDWQSVQLGYTYRNQIGGPMLAFEAYRWNVPVITYAFDSTFIRYFGTNGMAEVEKAIKILQDLPPVDQIVAVTNPPAFPGGTPTYDLIITNNGVPEIVPKSPYIFNQTAADLGIWDLKTVALFHLLEEIGLADPVQSVWNLRARQTPPGQTNYGIFINNYDPVTLQPTTNVNDITYGYQIFDPVAPGAADAVEVALTPDPLFNFPVASGIYGGGSTNLTTFQGFAFDRLSYDDVGGIRFIYSTNRLVMETLVNTGSSVTQRGAGPGPGSSPWTIVLGQTNSNTNGIIFTNITANLSNVVNEALRPGIGKLNFFRVEYDSLLGQTFVAVTNFYTDRYISNATYMRQPLQRVIRRPDIVFVAEDVGTVGVFAAISDRTTTDNWTNNAAINSPGGANVYGPGIINPPITIGFTDLLPYYFNSNPTLFTADLLPTEASGLFEGVWGSYDATTNAPIIYPIFMDFNLETIRSVLTNKTTIIRSK